MSAHAISYTTDGRVVCLAGDMEPGSITAFAQHNRDRRMREFVHRPRPCWVCGVDAEEFGYTRWAIAPGRVVDVCDVCAERGS